MLTAHCEDRSRKNWRKRHQIKEDVRFEEVDREEKLDMICR